MTWLSGYRRLTLGALGLGALCTMVLAVVATELAEGAIKRRVQAGLQSKAGLAALYVEAELRGLAQVNASFAQRPDFVGAVALAGGRDRSRAISRTLGELSGVRPGIATAFLARSDGRLVDIVPATPSIVGKSFAFRDWYRGVTATGRPYVSEAYRSQAAGRPWVVGVASPVHSLRGGTPTTKRIGILVVAYDLATIRAFSQRFADEEGLELIITDQRGALLSGSRAQRPVPIQGDPRVRLALAGRSGVGEWTLHGEQVVSAYAPVRGLGWAVASTLPASVAYAGFARFELMLLAIAGALGLLFLVCGVLLRRALRQREERDAQLVRAQTINRAVLDGVKEAISLTGPSGQTLLANAAMRRLQGELGEDALERAVPRAATRDAAVPLRLGGRSFEAFVGEVANPGGDEAGALTVLHETTKERQAERAKADLVANVSHELRTPLASVLGFAELLLVRAVGPEDRRRYVQAIHREACRLTELVDDFLDMRSIEERTLRLNLSSFGLDELLSELVVLFRGQSDRHQLVLELAGDPIEAAGDRNRIAQVVSNLLSNAIKYSPAGGTVTVTASLRDERTAHVSISDRGIGIDAAEQARIFERFVRGEAAAEREIRGTGLGLALARSLVREHGGELGVESRENEGATFWFTLPVAERERAAEDGDGRADPSGATDAQLAARTTGN